MKNPSIKSISLFISAHRRLGNCLLVSCVLVFLCLVTCDLYSQELLETQTPSEAKEQPLQIQRPDPNRIIAELSASLRLSSKQEDKIVSAVKFKSHEFDKYLKEYEKINEQAKKLRFKMNELKYKMYKISSQMPDVVRDFLDEEQRETYDEMILSKTKPSSKKEISGQEEQQTQVGEKPVKKKKLIRRKKKKLPDKTQESGTEISKEPAGSLPSGQQPPYETTEEEPDLGSYP